MATTDTGIGTGSDSHPNGVTSPIYDAAAAFMKVNEKALSQLKINFIKLKISIRSHLKDKKDLTDLTRKCEDLYLELAILLDSLIDNEVAQHFQGQCDKIETLYEECCELLKEEERPTSPVQQVMVKEVEKKTKSKFGLDDTPLNRNSQPIEIAKNLEDLSLGEFTSAEIFGTPDVPGPSGGLHPPQEQTAPPVSNVGFSAPSAPTPFPPFYPLMNRPLGTVPPPPGFLPFGPTYAGVFPPAISQFDGNYLHFCEFMHNFDSYIAAYAPDDGFRLLQLESLCTGEAKEAIAGIRKRKDKAEAYKVARERLNSRFGDRIRLMEQVRRELLGGNKVNEWDGRALTSLSDKMFSCENTFKSWNKLSELDSPDVIEKLFDRLPYKLKTEFIAFSQKNEGNGLFTGLRKILEKAAKDADSFLGQHLFESLNQKKMKKGTNFAKATVFGSNTKRYNKDQVEEPRTAKPCVMQSILYGFVKFLRINLFKKEASWLMKGGCAIIVSEVGISQMNVNLENAVLFVEGSITLYYTESHSHPARMNRRLMTKSHKTKVKKRKGSTVAMFAGIFRRVEGNCTRWYQ